MVVRKIVPSVVMLVGLVSIVASAPRVPLGQAVSTNSQTVSLPTNEPDRKLLMFMAQKRCESEEIVVTRLGWKAGGTADRVRHKCV